MSEVLNIKHQSKEVSMEVVEDDDCCHNSNTINNNNYKVTRDDAKVAETETFASSQDSEDVEIQSEMKMSVEYTEKNEDKTTAENLSMLSTVASDCPSDSSMTLAPCSVRQNARPLTFSIDQIMATGHGDVSGQREAATTEDVVTSEGLLRERPQQRGHTRLWTQSKVPSPTAAAAAAAAAAVNHQKFEGNLRNQGAASWLNRLQQEASELQQLVATGRHHQQASVDWRSSSALSTLISHVSPLLLYRHLQSSLASSWLDALRHTLPGTSSLSSSSNDQHSQLQQPAMTLLGRRAWHRDSEHRHPVYMPYTGLSRRTTGTLDGNRIWQNLTACDWFSRNKVPETPKYAASGALDLSLRSTVHHHPQSTNDNSAFGMTLSKNSIEKKQSMWLPTVDLKNSLENIVNQDVERPVKQISCPVCGKMFNAHYNLTRHMPVHTGARPFICKV